MYLQNNKKKRQRQTSQNEMQQKKRIKPNLLNEIKEVKHRQIKLVGKIIKRKQSFHEHFRIACISTSRHCEGISERNER